MTDTSTAPLTTPFEAGNQNQTTTWHDCIAFYEKLASAFPAALRFMPIGQTDNGHPLHAGVVTADGVFDAAALKAAGRPVFFNNNGIHPGEPEGIDACMALVRDFCVQPAKRAALGQTVFVFIPVYNVDGCLMRNTSSRVNQLGPESFGFRANGLNLDLNRDFIKCDSLAAQAFNRFFTAWSPDVMVDTHTSNGADYPYTMTLIHTQPDKLGGALGDYLKRTMLPALYASMDEAGWPVVPYVQPVNGIPDNGIEQMLDVPRFSTGYATLHHTIGFMPETHMLKPYADRYAATRALVLSVLDFTVQHAASIQALRRAAKAEAGRKTHWPVQWQIDRTRPSTLRFTGYKAVYSPSALGNYLRLSYDRSQPWQRDIVFYGNCVEDVVVRAPQAYLVPQAWRGVLERLGWNGVQLERLSAPRQLAVQCLHITRVVTRPGPYEGHMFHDAVDVAPQLETHQAQAGDCLITLDQPNARYAVETLEPQAHDSFFRWGFFNSVLEKKEHFSDYVFEDTAQAMLNSEPELKAAFEAWKAANPALLGDAHSVLGFVFAHGKRFAEPTWRRYPVLRVL